MARVVIGLGSNVGDRFATLEAAVRDLALSVDVLAVSHVFETAPVGGPPQGPFLNAATLVCWNEDLHVLLDLLLGIEAKLGRVRRERWGPRTLDLDMLWTDAPPVNSARLVVPHPRLLERAFASEPLLELLPLALDGRRGAPAAPAVARLSRTLALPPLSWEEQVVRLDVSVTDRISLSPADVAPLEVRLGRGLPEPFRSFYARYAGATLFGGLLQIWEAPTLASRQSQFRDGWFGPEQLFFAAAGPDAQFESQHLAPAPDFFFFESAAASVGTLRLSPTACGPVRVPFGKWLERAARSRGHQLAPQGDGFVGGASDVQPPPPARP
ncbi:MAG: 2-amino-4-hydroxy-6-hydroxymethyldihydropteridine diphosphokinase [Myxococcales bacterium]|nr:2-amino-4-hydroxy-6-hydroxymethyldihydropteridine diphosphokinase [Myxococcales bacterium]